MKMAKIPKFYENTYRICRKVPKGKVTTYKKEKFK